MVVGLEFDKARKHLNVGSMMWGGSLSMWALPSSSSLARIDECKKGRVIAPLWFRPAFAKLSVVFQVGLSVESSFVFEMFTVFSVRTFGSPSPVYSGVCPVRNKAALTGTVTCSDLTMVGTSLTVVWRRLFSFLVACYKFG